MAQSVAGAGFSAKPPWADDAQENLGPGHTMSFRDALHTVMHDIFWKIALPDAAFKLPVKRLQTIKTGFEEVRDYFMEMIQQRKGSGGDVRVSDTGKNDLLGALVHATADSSAEGLEEDEMEREELKKKAASLSDEEGPAYDLCSSFTPFACQQLTPIHSGPYNAVMGNIYVFLLAGHDTTAHTLAFALSLLALYPDIQMRALEQINSVLAPGVEPVSEHSPFCGIVFFDG